MSLMIKIDNIKHRLASKASYAGSWCMRSVRSSARLVRGFGIFNRRQVKSLASRLQLLFLCWGLLVYLLAVSGFWFVSTSVIDATLRHQTTQWLEKIDGLSTPLYASHDINEFNSIKNYVENINEIAYVNFYDGNSLKNIGSYKKELLDAGAIPVLDKKLLAMKRFSALQVGEGVVDRSLKDHGLLRIISPVAIASIQADELLDFDLDSPEDDSVIVIGYMDVGIDYSFYTASLIENIIKGSVSIFIIFLIAAVIGQRVIKNALRPLSALREPLERLAEGDTDVSVKQGGDAEIAAISTALSSTISAIKGRDAELRRLADFDPLTGLYNKRSFSALFEKECQRIEQESDSGALLFIDLDQFKYVNDSLGHAAGDRLLIEVSTLLKQRLRGKDIVSRMGGDEFTILASSVDKAGAAELAGDIVKEIGAFLFIEAGKSFNIGCSIGVALIDGGRFSHEELFAHADMACYSAKSQGRNRYHFYEPALAEKTRLDIGWSQRITEALGEDKFELHFQPIITASSHQTEAYEVLVRLRDEMDNFVLPGLFIPVAERFGLAAEIDYWVIRNTLKLIEGQGSTLRFHINLSEQIFSSPEFVSRLIKISGNMNLYPGQIVFELSEQTAVLNINHTVRRMEELQYHGFNFAIDKFGSGFNSFSYLRHMPVNYVKVSGEFIERMIEDDVDKAMVKSIVDIAKACNKMVIAEYVPGKNSLNLLQDFGVDFMQGNYIAEPRGVLTPASVSPSVPTNISSIAPEK